MATNLAQEISRHDSAMSVVGSTLDQFNDIVEKLIELPEGSAEFQELSRRKETLWKALTQATSNLRK